MSPEISVILPVYNLQAQIRRCLDSLLGGSFRDLEVLCIDDGSTDATPALLDAAASRDSRVRVFHIPNGGVSAARNLGLAQAAGRYIFFLDGDDWLHSGCLDHLWQAARRSDAALTAARLIPVAEPLPEHRDTPDFRSLTAEAFLQDISKAYCTGKLFARRMLEGCRFEPSLRYGEDTLFMLDVLTAAALRGDTILLTETPLYFYYTRPGSATHSVSPHRLTAMLDAMERHARMAPPAVQYLYWQECCKQAARFARRLGDAPREQRDCLQGLERSVAALRRAPGMSLRRWLPYAGLDVLSRCPALYRLIQRRRDDRKSRQRGGI